MVELLGNFLTRPGHLFLWLVEPAPKWVCAIMRNKGGKMLYQPHHSIVLRIFSFYLKPLFPHGSLGYYLPFSIILHPFISLHSSGEDHLLYISFSRPLWYVLLGHHQCHHQWGRCGDIYRWVLYTKSNEYVGIHSKLRRQNNTGGQWCLCYGKQYDEDSNLVRITRLCTCLAL